MIYSKLYAIDNQWSIKIILFLLINRIDQNKSTVLLKLNPFHCQKKQRFRIGRMWILPKKVDIGSTKNQLPSSYKF
jgi:hypothetical protein